MTSLRLLATAGVLAAAVLSGCSTDDAQTGDAPGAPASAPSAGAATTSAEPHNDADVQLTAMMIPHHAQAIEMSDTLLGKQGVQS